MILERAETAGARRSSPQASKHRLTIKRILVVCVALAAGLPGLLRRRPQHGRTYGL